MGKKGKKWSFESVIFIRDHGVFRKGDVLTKMNMDSDVVKTWVAKGVVKGKGSWE